MKELTNKQMKSVDGGKSTSTATKEEIRYVKSGGADLCDKAGNPVGTKLSAGTKVQILKFSSNKSKLPKGFETTGTLFTYIKVLEDPTKTVAKNTEGFVKFTTISNSRKAPTTK